MKNKLKWTFRNFRISNGDLRNQARLLSNFYHTFRMNKKRKDGTFSSFIQEMKEIEPNLLHHPKVRIKATLFK
jgi:hypothetical protein